MKKLTENSQLHQPEQINSHHQHLCQLSDEELLLIKGGVQGDLGISDQVKFIYVSGPAAALPLKPDQYVKALEAQVQSDFENGIVQTKLLG